MKSINSLLIIASCTALIPAQALGADLEEKIDGGNFKEIGA